MFKLKSGSADQPPRDSDPSSSSDDDSSIDSDSSGDDLERQLEDVISSSDDDSSDDSSSDDSDDDSSDDDQSYSFHYAGEELKKKDTNTLKTIDDESMYVDVRNGDNFYDEDNDDNDDDSWVDPVERRFRLAKRCAWIFSGCICCLLTLWGLAVGGFFAYVKIKSNQAENSGGGGSSGTMSPVEAPLIITRPPALADYDPSTVELPESLAAYETCFVCGDNNNQEVVVQQQSMSNPKALVYISPQNSMEFISANNYNGISGGIETDVSCDSLRIAGLYGFIDPDSCSNLQNQLSMKERCGCNIIVSASISTTDTSGSTTDATAATTVPATTTTTTTIEKSDIPCYLCGEEDATLSNPDSILVLPDFLGYPDDFTCSNLDRLGRFNYGNSISEIGCGILQSQTEILIQCGCSNVIGSGTSTATGSSSGVVTGQDGVDATTNNGENNGSNFALASFPPCYICGDDDNSMNSNGGTSTSTGSDGSSFVVSNVRSPKIGTLTTPSNILTLPSILGFGDTATCQDINAVGVSGFIQPDGCIALQSKEIMEQCGCSNTLIVEEDEEDPAVVIQPNFPSCFICGGSNNGLVGNPDAILSLPSALGFGDNASCQDVNAVGVTGYISPGACTVIQEEKEIIDNCGCGGVDEVAPVIRVDFPSCSLCGSKRLAYPKAVLNLPSGLGYGDSAPCEAVNALGLTGYISEGACSFIQQQDTIIETCGCGIQAEQQQDEDEEEESFPSCYVCGSRDVILSVPEAALSLPPLLGYGDSVTCQVADAIGITGLISPSACLEIQNETSIKDQCGCRSSSSSDVDTSTTTATGDVSEAQPPCFLCGEEFATISNPDLILDLPDFLGYPDDITCKGLDDIGRFDRTISPTGCNIMQSQTEMLQQCGCSNIVPQVSTPTTNVEAPSTEEEEDEEDEDEKEEQQQVPDEPPIEPEEEEQQQQQQVPDEPPIEPEEVPPSQPQEPPCFMCGEESATISNPDFVLELPPFLGYPPGTTCADLERIGRFDGTINPAGCAILQQQTEVLCGCSNIVVDNVSPPSPPTEAKEFPPSQTQPSCFLCGGSDDTISRPDLVLNLPPFLGYPPGTTCGDIDRIGRFEGTITPDLCNSVQSQIQALCECSNIIVGTPPEDVRNPACYTCGSAEVVLGNPEFVLQSLPPSLGFSDEGATCDTLNKAGISGIITPFECDIMASNDFIKTQCGCENVTPPPQPPCFTCGGSDDTISNPDFVLQLPPFLGYPPGTTCGDIDRIGRFDGTIDPEGCGILQSQIQSLCGCSNIAPPNAGGPPASVGGPPQGVGVGGPPADVGGPPPGVVPGVGEEVSESFPPCLLCGEESATISNPDTILELPPFLGYPPGTTCADLERIGRFDGTINPGGCAILQQQTEVICGCSNLDEEASPPNTGGPPASVGAGGPPPGVGAGGPPAGVGEQVSESFPPCLLCGEESATISNPDTILELPPFLGYPPGTTCADLERIGRFDGTINPGGCAILQQQTEVICGCSNLDEEASPPNAGGPPAGVGAGGPPPGVGAGGPPADVGGPPPGVVTGGPPAGVGEEVSESFPPCYWCGGSESDTTSNPDELLNLPPFLGYPPDTTCGDLERIGRFDGTISPGGCAIVQDQTAILEKCGCEIGV